MARTLISQARSAISQARTVIQGGDTQQPIGLLLTLTHTVATTGRSLASNRSAVS